MLATIDDLDQQWIEMLRWMNDDKNAGVVEVPERFHLTSEAETVRLPVPRIVRKSRFALLREELTVLRARAEMSLLGLKIWLRS
jgi:hypothetical protein